MRSLLPLLFALALPAEAGPEFYQPPANGATTSAAAAQGDTLCRKSASGGVWEDCSSSETRTAIGLGTIATQAASSVSITGGSVVGITDLAVPDGGTGASTAIGAVRALGDAVGIQTLTDGATIAWDTSLGDKAKVTIAANRTLSNPTSVVGAGQELWLLVTEDGTGGRALALDTAFAGPVNIRQVAGSTTPLGWIYDGSSWLNISQPRLINVRLLDGPLAQTAATTQIGSFPAAYTTTSRGPEINLASARTVRITGRVAGGTSVSGSKFGVEYTADNGSTWAHLDGSSSGAFTGDCTAIAVDTTAVVYSAGGVGNGWCTLATGARTDVLLRLVYGGGNGSGTLTLTDLTLEAM